MKMLLILLLLLPTFSAAQGETSFGQAKIPRMLREINFSFMPEVFLPELSQLDELDWKDPAVTDREVGDSTFLPDEMVHAFLVQEPKIEMLDKSDSAKTCRDVWQELWLVKIKIAKIKKLRAEIDAQFRRLKASDPNSLQAKKYKEKIDGLLITMNNCIRDINFFAESQSKEIPDRLVTYTFALNGKGGRILLAEKFLGAGDQEVQRFKMASEKWLTYSPDSYSIVGGFQRIQPRPNRTWILQRKVKPTMACEGNLDFTIDFVSSWQQFLPTELPYLNAAGDVTLDPLKPVYKVIVRVHSWVYDL